MVYDSAPRVYPPTMSLPKDSPSESRPPPRPPFSPLPPGQDFSWSATERTSPGENVPGSWLHTPQIIQQKKNTKLIDSFSNMDKRNQLPLQGC